MKEMVYSKDIKREVLDEGKFNGFDYYILNLGMHPTAYVRIPERHKFYRKFYDEIDIDCHWGLTYSREYLLVENDTKLEGWFIGWDYGHCNDWASYLTDEQNIELENKKWTTEEIQEEVKDVCCQLAKE